MAGDAFWKSQPAGERRLCPRGCSLGGAGIYQIALGKAADHIIMTANATMEERRFGS
jgi:hypothetical protein